MKHFLTVLVSLALLIPSAVLMADPPGPPGPGSQRPGHRPPGPPGGGPGLQPTAEGTASLGAGRQTLSHTERLRNLRPFVPLGLGTYTPQRRSIDNLAAYSRPGYYAPYSYFGDARRPAQGRGGVLRADYPSGDGLRLGYVSGGGWYGRLSYGYQGDYSPRRSRNWRFLDTGGFVDNYYGTDYRQRLYYDRLDQESFPAVLADLSEGVFGALMVWPEQPGIVAHSAALEKFFAHLDLRIRARLRYAEGVSTERRLNMAREMVREALRPLVDSVTVEGGEYHVRFRMPDGRPSPWVMVPVVFGAIDGAGLGMGLGRTQDGYQYTNSFFEGFHGTGAFEPAGPFFYPDPERGASLEDQAPAYDTASLYWRER
ncbi:MAG: hypothetical protein LBP92_04970 [Deltaproteobacteria bacterium]|jgi:hypothetical protein|nr:hypothetical protein [Deltaproteobacteria bacterium]